MKEPLIIASEFQDLNAIIERVESDKIWLRNVVCFMMYYNNPKSGKITRRGVKYAVLELFRADAYRQREWLKYGRHERNKMATYSEIESLLNEERFREYDVKAAEIVEIKYKTKFK